MARTIILAVAILFIALLALGIIGALRGPPPP
jgi:hypothetical protein